MQPAINANHSADDLFSQQQASIVRLWDKYDKKQKLHFAAETAEGELCWTPPPFSQVYWSTEQDAVHRDPPGSAYKTELELKLTCMCRDAPLAVRLW